MPTTKKPAPRFKNYMSEMEVDTSLTIIRKSLMAHGAKRIIFEGSDSEGNPTGISFVLVVHGQSLAFKMPVHLEQVRALVEQAWIEYGRPLGESRLDEQTQRTGWCNLKDWVLAQMALIESSGSSVKMEEVFFPYLIDQDGHTVFEAFEKRLALPSPNPKNNKQQHY